ncbi:outer envelope protein [Pseudorhodoferax sp. Leaf274]|uniref:outer envelope protein n=1 Tax=Pseudorhodoferax sp. Leaf274 TaxID=1736318 RepID=UPI000702F045|nr:outer envelope protein [Pseudorhodoferax sp. Leaf274]KQP48620.1 outer envelope protein [Pseudorhodoferax sp. Leaf274]
MHRNRTLHIAAAAVLACAASGAQAADWSDTSMGVRWGTKFAEPYNTQDIEKTIVNFTHASGYKYGSNFLNVDFLMSDGKDSNAQEIYVVYRHTLDLGKVTGKSFAFGPVKGLGLTAGFDVNTKNDPNYASKKRMVVAGPTFMVDVPAGFLNVGVYALWESNKPVGVAERYSYDVHPMLNLAWGIPVGNTGLSFEGFLNYIGDKGPNEFGGPTSPETNLDMTLFYDVSPHIGASKNSFRVGVGYQYWRNKFGNPHSVPGSLAKTPMVRADYHF